VNAGGLGECSLAEETGTYAYVGLPIGSPPQRIGDGCGYSNCRTSIEALYQPAQCEYGRRGVVIRNRAASADRAEAFVGKALQKPGYRPARVGADRAAIVTGPSGGIVVLAVGRITIVYALGAYSDVDSSPGWAAGRQLKAGARTIAGFLTSNR
jgi:hypothetical protein